MTKENTEIPQVMGVEKASSKLKIAIIYSRSPFPMMRGDQLTVTHLIQYLNERGHEVTLYTTNLDGELSHTQEVWLGNSCKQTNIFQISKVQRLYNALTGLLKLWPLQIGFFYSKDLTLKAQKEIYKGSFDVVYTYYLRSAPVTEQIDTISKNTELKTASFLAMQLSQTLNTLRIFKHENNIIKKLIYFIEWRLLRRYESRIWKKYTKTVLIGQKDVEAVADACKEENQPVINNWIYGAHGTDINKFKPALDTDITPGRVVFSGSMLYQPNIQAVQWFVKNCWNSIRNKNPESELYIVGRDPVTEIQALDGKNGIHVTGTVKDVGEYIRTANVCINPMLAAGGMQNKLIEYMACRKAIVATSIANEGIQAPNDTLIIADNAQTFTEGVCRFINDGKLVSEFSDKAREYVKVNWTWEAHFKLLENSFHEALKNIGNKN